MITVFGSLNVDYVFQVAQLPAPGETVLAANMEVLPGGKGGNQALAAARAGAKVQMVGAVGKDGLGDIAIAGLIAALKLPTIWAFCCATGLTATSHCTPQHPARSF